jgi:hypothetical protein
MKRIVKFVSTASLLLSCSVAVLAQTAPPPPSIILIVREEIKPGEMPAHQQEAAAFIRVLEKANSRISDEKLRDGRIGMSPIAGNENEVAYLWGYDSLGDMEAKAKASEKLANDPAMMKADFDRLPDNRLHISQRDTVAAFRSDLSYGIGRIDIAEARYMVMTTFRIKPGHEDEYWEMDKKHVFPARDKAGIKASYAIYQSVAGVPNGTFFQFRPIRSLAELDERAPIATRNAMSGDTKDEVDKVTDRTMLMSETMIYRINPRISLVAPSMAARDKSTMPFWNPKPEPEPMTAERRSGGRSGRRQ